MKRGLKVYAHTPHIFFQIGLDEKRIERLVALGVIQTEKPAVSMKRGLKEL
jgi:hypothetical protein